MLSDEYVTEAEAVRILGVSQPTVWRWIKQGSLPAERVGRATLIRRKDLELVRKTNFGGRPKSHD